MKFDHTGKGSGGSPKHAQMFSGKRVDRQIYDDK